MYRKKKIILFFIYSHDKFFALSLLNTLEKKIMESHYMTLLDVSSSSIWIILMRKHVNLEWERMDAQSAFDGINLYITYLVYIFKSPPFLSSQSRIGINRQLFDPSLDLDYPGQNQLLVKHMMQVKGNNG